MFAAWGAKRLTSCPQVLELANTLDAGGLVEVCTADRPPNHVPVRAARDDVELLVLHDVEELGPYFPRLAQRLGMQEVASCPRVRVAVQKALESAHRNRRATTTRTRAHPFDFHCV